MTLTDDAAKTAIASLGDGIEVVILAWRPGWAGTTRYRVQVTGSGVEGWLPVGNLRSTEFAISPAVTSPPHRSPLPRSGEIEGPRRFGQRSR